MRNLCTLYNTWHFYKTFTILFTTGLSRTKVWRKVPHILKMPLNQSNIIGLPCKCCYYLFTYCEAKWRSPAGLASGRSPAGLASKGGWLTTWTASNKNQNILTRGFWENCISAFCNGVIFTHPCIFRRSLADISETVRLRWIMARPTFLLNSDFNSSSGTPLGGPRGSQGAPENLGRTHLDPKSKKNAFSFLQFLT